MLIVIYGEGFGLPHFLFSKETMQYFSNQTESFYLCAYFENGSWLNLVETLSSKMARTFLKGIRVKTREDLCERI